MVITCVQDKVAKTLRFKLVSDATIMKYLFVQAGRKFRKVLLILIAFLVAPPRSELEMYRRFPTATSASWASPSYQRLVFGHLRVDDCIDENQSIFEADAFLAGKERKKKQENSGEANLQ